MPERDPRPIELVMTLRKQGITDARVLSAIERTPRELFVEPPFTHAAYENTALPIPCGQTISQPYVVAISTEALELGPEMRVLEIGTGSGYQAAVLSALCRRVYTIERHKPLLREAEARFKALKLENVVTRHGDGYKGWPEQAPFDRILLTAAVTQIPPIVTEQLKTGGIMVAPLGPPAAGDLESISQLLTKMIRNETGLKQEALIPVVFVPMVRGLPQEQRETHDGSDKRR
jgi:protein-L-isoaspartate(D-aspartate) O-methyltransferase